jgi:hypothetical protein
VVVDCDSNRIKKGPGGRWGGTSGDDKGSPELGERTNCRFSFSASTPVFCLTHSAEEVPLGNTWFKTTPPVRHEAHREALWDALRDGIIHSISSGHSPCHARVEKEMFQASSVWALMQTSLCGILKKSSAFRSKGYMVDTRQAFIPVERSQVVFFVLLYAERLSLITTEMHGTIRQFRTTGGLAVPSPPFLLEGF